MEPKRETTRRDFLTGRSATGAASDLANRDAPTEPPSPLAAERRPASYLMQISRRAMAAEFQIYLNVGQHPQGPDAALKALDLVAALEDQMTVYREHSEVMDINRRAADGPVGVEARLFAVLELALQLYRETDGAFDITSGPLSKVWGFYRRQGMFPDEAAMRQARSRVGSDSVDLDSPRRTIRFLRRNVDINLNAIGKGYALDRCAEILREAGVENFLIHGGKSSVLAAGARTESGDAPGGWTVAVRHPLKPNQRLGELQVRDRAVGTSGSGTQFFHHKGRRYGHVLDPRTGWPAEGVLSATVLAPTAALADAVSTAFYVMGLDKISEFCRLNPELSAIVVCPGERSGSIAVHPIAMEDEVWRSLIP